MANRFNAQGKVTQGQRPLPTGYPEGATGDLVIPPVGLEDVDTALFRLFDKELPFAVGNASGGDLKKVPVIFAGGEKWAMLKQNRPLRDKSNSLILPLITIGRPNFSQDPSADIVGRGINQQTGEIVIRRRLDSADRNYQNIINKFLLRGQDNVAVSPSVATGAQLSTLSDVGQLEEDPTIRKGGLLLSDRRNNVFETLVVPSPQFITVNYEVTIWTQYTHHMNQISETLLSSFLPQMRGWRLDTPKGYWFIARMSDSAFNFETNFDDMSQGERVIKQKFNVEVPAYVFASSAPGVPIPVKRYVSAPNISFTVGLPAGQQVPIDSQPALTIDDPFLGADDPTLPLADRDNGRPDRRRTGTSRFFASNDVDRDDPALRAQPRGTDPSQYTRVLVRGRDGKIRTEYVKVTNKNSFTGETAFSSGNASLGGFSIVGIEE